jgi:transporter family-2 protein
MNQVGLWTLLAISVGLLQPVIWQMNLKVADSTGVLEAAVVLHVVGTLFGLVLLFANGRIETWAGLSSVPLWAWTAGAIGVSSMALLNRAIPIVGLASVLACVVAAQFCASLLFETTGWLDTTLRAVTPTRAIGAAFLVIGAFLISKGATAHTEAVLGPSGHDGRTATLTAESSPLP